MEYNYKPTGVCARGIKFEIEDGKIKNVRFSGGCNGNTKGISLLTEGMDAREVVKRLEGVTCGFKPTSCPDQLAKAIKKALEEN